MSEIADEGPWGVGPEAGVAARPAKRSKVIRRHFGLGLRLRSALFLILILATPAALLLQQAASQRAALVDAAEARVLEVARQVVSRDEALVDRGRLLLEDLADLARPSVPLSDLCRSLEAPTRREAGWVLGGMLAGPDGAPICSFGARPPLRPGEDSRRFLADTAAGHGFQVDEIRFQAPAPLYLVALRLSHADGSTAGALALALNLDALRDGRDGLDMLILDRTGVVLFDTAGASRPGERITAHPVLPRLMIEAEGTGSGTDSSGGVRLYAFTQLPASGAKFVVGIPRATVLGGLEAATREALMLLMGASMLALLGFWAAAELSVFRWLDRLVRATQAVAAGDLDGLVEIPRSAGEFAILARSFNHMTRRLAARGREIEAQRRIQLEGEARIRDYAEVASDWFWEADPDGVLRYLSDRFDETAGVPAAALLNARQDELAAQTAEGLPALAAALRSRRPFRNLVIRMVLPGDEERYWRLSGKPVHDLSGRFAGYRGTGTDITREKLDEAALQRAKQAAEAANLAKSQFLANMSHELRTPLAAIIGFAEVIRDGLFGPVAPARYQEYVADIHASATHLLSIINDILDVARIDAGRETLNEELFELPRMIASAVRILQGRANERGVALSLANGESTHTLFGDERRLRQAVLNIAGNAIKFTPEGGRVEIAVEVDAAGIALIVSDTGIGISAADLAQVFRPFWQAETSLGRERDGVGLGLTLTRQLVELHGGTLSLASEPGRGTVATIRLPAWRCSSPADAGGAEGSGMLAPVLA